MEALLCLKLLQNKLLLFKLLICDYYYYYLIKRYKKCVCRKKIGFVRKQILLKMAV